MAMGRVVQNATARLVGERRSRYDWNACNPLQ
jgi:hypothetical protein